MTIKVFVSVLSFFFSLTIYAQDKLQQIMERLEQPHLELSEGEFTFIKQHITPTIGIKTFKSSDSQIAIGSSKIGGLPDLPKEFLWPKFQGKPLTFCAQYNLSEIGKIFPNNNLPKQGLLAVFIYIDADWPGFMNSIYESYRVVYIKNTKKLIRTQFPMDYFKDGIFQPAKISFFEHYTLPEEESYKSKLLALNYKSYYQMVTGVNRIISEVTKAEENNFHQLLGQPRSIQYSVLKYFAEKELQIKNQQDFHSNTQKIEVWARKYKLLLQLDCADPNTNLNKYGGSMTIYFGIEPDYLEKIAFDRIIMAFQGT